MDDQSYESAFMYGRNEVDMANARAENKAQARLLAEAHQISYRLRSTFFYRKMKEYDVLAFLL